MRPPARRVGLGRHFGVAVNCISRGGSLEIDHQYRSVSRIPLSSRRVSRAMGRWSRRTAIGCPCAGRRNLLWRGVRVPIACRAYGHNRIASSSTPMRLPLWPTTGLIVQRGAHQVPPASSVSAEARDFRQRRPKYSGGLRISPPCRMRTSRRALHLPQAKRLEHPWVRNYLRPQWYCPR